MTLCELMAKSDKVLRPLLNSISPAFSVKVYSTGRKLFIKMLSNESIDGRLYSSPELSRKLWNLEFSSPLLNAAGMFKYGEGYDTAYRQGAGAYLCGTSTFQPREGNSKAGVQHPFVSYPKSGSASNWMGLPNHGHSYLANAVNKINKKPGCPIGVSISPNPEHIGDEALNGVIEGLRIFEATQADFIEFNESCPNVAHECEIDSASGLDLSLIRRLQAISSEFLRHRSRNLPVIVKFSNDTDVRLVPKLIDILLECGFDGANFGNTSTDYDVLRPMVNDRDKPTFDYFTSTFGGGVSGAVLKKKSFTLCYAAMSHLNSLELPREFHVIRTGGIESFDDIEQSERIGVAMNQWFTGYFEAFAADGHHLYDKLFN